jgi:pimeloyl-ACP methyl ester carboxylesterase
MATAVGLVALVAAGLLGYVAFLVVRFMVRVFLADPTVTFEFAEGDAASAGDDLTVEAQKFRASDGVELAGVLVKGAGEPRGLVVFAPEFGGDADTWKRYAAFVPRAGYWLLAFDFRGTGRSGPCEGYVPRKWASEKELADLAGAVAHARQLGGGRFAKVALFGISRGGLTSLALAEQDAGIAGVVLEGSGSTLEVIHSYTVKWSRVYAPERLCAAIPWWAYRLISRFVLGISARQAGYRFIEIGEVGAPASGGPCLVIHGQRDRHVVPEMAQTAFDRFPGTKELWMVAGARHNGAVLKAPDEYRERVLAHLAKLSFEGSKNHKMSQGGGAADSAAATAASCSAVSGT